MTPPAAPDRLGADDRRSLKIHDGYAFAYGPSYRGRVNASSRIAPRAWRYLACTVEKAAAVPRADCQGNFRVKPATTMATVNPCEAWRHLARRKAAHSRDRGQLRHRLPVLVAIPEDCLCRRNQNAFVSLGRKDMLTGAAQFVLGATRDEVEAKTVALGRGHERPVALAPLDPYDVAVRGIARPAQRNLPGIAGPRAMLRRVRGQFVQDKSESDHDLWLEADLRAAELQPVRSLADKVREDGIGHLAELRTLPVLARQDVMGRRHGMELPVQHPGKLVLRSDAIGRLPDHRLYACEVVLHPVIQLGHHGRKPFLRPLALGNVHEGQNSAVNGVALVAVGQHAHDQRLRRSVADFDLVLDRLTAADHVGHLRLQRIEIDAPRKLVQRTTHVVVPQAEQRFRGWREIADAELGIEKQHRDPGVAEEVLQVAVGAAELFDPRGKLVVDGAQFLVDRL